MYKRRQYCFETHLGHMELVSVSLSEGHGPLARRDEFEGDDLHVDRWNARARSVRSDLREPANLLLADRGVVLQRETVRFQRVRERLHAHARLDRNLLLLQVQGDDLVEEPEHQHPLLLETAARKHEGGYRATESAQVIHSITPSPAQCRLQRYNVTALQRCNVATLTPRT